MYKIFIFTLTLLTGCATSVNKESSIAANEPCSNAGLKNAFYVGSYKGKDDTLKVEDFHRDLYCADAFIREKYPDKFLTIFGSSRIFENNKMEYPNQNEEITRKNDLIYQQTYEFAKLWSNKYGDRYPVLTGAGPGLMEAAARGAIDGGGRSIGYTTYYAKAATTGDPKYAFWKYNFERDIITDGMIFTSVSIRETAMIMHSAAAVFVPGGGGTNWEIFQMLEMLKSNQLTDIKVYFLGDKSHWVSYEEYVKDMERRSTIKTEDLPRFITFVSSNEELLNKLKIDLNL